MLFRSASTPPPPNHPHCLCPPRWLCSFSTNFRHFHLCFGGVFPRFISFHFDSRTELIEAFSAVHVIRTYRVAAQRTEHHILPCCSAPQPLPRTQPFTLHRPAHCIYNSIRRKSSHSPSHSVDRSLQLLLLPSLICAFHSCPNVQGGRQAVGPRVGQTSVHFLLHCIHCAKQQQQSSVRAHCSLTVDAWGSCCLPSACLSFWHLPGCRHALARCPGPGPSLLPSRSGCTC